MSAPSKEDIYARSEQVGQCVVWKGPVSGSVPQVFKAGHYFSCRRVVYESGGVKIPAGQSPVNWCRTLRCVCREHLTLMTPKQIGELAAREGKFSTPERRQAITEGRRRSGRGMKLDEEKAADIKACTNGVEAAKKHGIHRALASRIRRGEAWRTEPPPSDAPRVKVTVIPTPPPRFAPTPGFERVITADAILRRQGVDIRQHINRA